MSKIEKSLSNSVNASKNATKLSLFILLNAARVVVRIKSFETKKFWEPSGLRSELRTPYLSKMYFLVYFVVYSWCTLWYINWCALWCIYGALFDKFFNVLSGVIMMYSVVYYLMFFVVFLWCIIWWIQ